MAGHIDDRLGQEKYDILPDDIFIQIIKFIPIIQWPPLELIDHKFKRSVHGAWHSLRKIRLDEDFSINSSNFKEEILNCLLKKLLERAPCLNSISGFSTILQFGRFPLRQNIIQLLSQFKCLERLSTSVPLVQNLYSGFGITISDLANFLNASLSSHRLKELDVVITVDEDTYSYNSYRRQSDAQLLRQAFWRPTLELENLRLAGVEDGLTLRFTDIINVTSLTKLDLFECDLVSNDLALLIGRCFRLENLAFNFTCSAYCSSGLTFPHKRLLEALKISENLSRLKMGYKYKNIHSSCGCLESLRSYLVGTFDFFGQSRRITDLTLTNYFCDKVVLEAVANCGSDLINLNLSLNIYSFDSEWIKYLISSLRRLKKLRLEGKAPFDNELIPYMVTCLGLELECLHLYNDDAQVLPRDFSELANLPNLKEFYVSRASFDLETLIYWKERALWELESLGLPYFRGPIISTLLWIMLINKMNGLRRLDLTGTEVSDGDLETIARAWPFLNEVNLTDCLMITERGIRTIVDGCSDLKRLQVPKCLWECEALQIMKFRNLKFGRIL